MQTPPCRSSTKPVELSPDTTLTSALRLHQQASSSSETTHGDQVLGKQVAFQDGSPVTEDAVIPPSPKIHTPPPRACMEPDRPREGEGFPAGSLVMVRVRPFFGRSKDRHWYTFLGHSVGVASDSRRNERVRINIPSLGVDVSIPWTCVGLTPAVQRHKLPATWLTQYLYTSPLDLDERGVSIQAVRVPEGMTEWLQGWDGIAVRPARQDIQHLRGEDMRQLITRPGLSLNWTRRRATPVWGRG